MKTNPVSQGATMPGSSYKYKREQNVLVSQLTRAGSVAPAPPGHLTSLPLFVESIGSAAEPAWDLFTSLFLGGIGRDLNRPASPTNTDHWPRSPIRSSVMWHRPRPVR